MKVTQDAIRRFFNNACSGEEAQQVYDYLCEHPEVIDQYIAIDEWAQFVPGQHLSPALKNKMATAIRAAQQPAPAMERIPVYRRLLKPLMAAASVMLVIGTGYWALSKRTPPAKPLVAQTQPAPTHTTIENKKRHIVRVTLPDSSQADLSPDAELVYNNDFNVTRRSIHLKGQAVFYVAHNKSKPFTVYSRNIATTALGTVFRVISNDALDQTRVYLLQGKVVVTPDSSLLAAGIKPAYLTPGQELSFNNTNHHYLVKDVLIKRPPVATPAEKTPVPEPVIAFEDQPLPAIFDMLQRRYKTRIHCNKEALAKITFTGSFNTAKQPLEIILRKITDLNSLQLTVTTSGYTIQ